ncbi:hypothetical protein OGAPHI_000890 [Ogataea philodendri]|uniref:Nitrite reductase [NAD(P)H] n=1 Tax=Ogataea philodendri TaxID=1378263 RepID=A0A9P8PF24_9ASCO|nr:uncharacterized protein OGAPHI_000890 [Ogataea philodendri]KAH3670375.1 hypothetical protein OGAPHI_000890 [Ogataea philodendri]
MTSSMPPLPEESKPPVEKKRLIIVGLGMVGLSFLEKLLLNDSKLDEFTISVYGEEPYLAYNRVGLTEYFQHRNFNNLLLSPEEFYQTRDQKWNYVIDEKVTDIDRERKTISTSKGKTANYDFLVLCTGSTAILPIGMLPPPTSKTYKEMGCFVYRTIDDLYAMVDFCKGPRKKRAIVVGGGLLGLEAAKALYDMESFDEITIVHRSKWLLSQQMDQKGGALLTSKVRDLGIICRTGTTISELQFDQDQNLTGVKYDNGEEEECSLLCYTIGIQPRDDLKSTGLDVGSRGGFKVDNVLKTSDDSIYAIGECASWNNMTFGLIAPGYEMADILAFNLTQGKFHQFKEFSEPNMGTRLKLMGVDVASFGDFFADRNGPKWVPRGYEKEVRALVFEDPIDETYAKLLFTKDGKYLLGGILVGDTSNYTKYSSMVQKKLTMSPSELIIGKPGDDDVEMLSDDTQVCSCHNITKGKLVEAVKNGCTSLGDLKKCTKAGTACGGCEPTVKVIFEAEMKKMGNKVSNNLCTHFQYSRADLFSLIMVKKFQSFKQVMENLGADPSAVGCEICKPTVGSILSTLYNRHLLKKEVHGLQDTNDRYLGNIQRNGTFSVVPRMSAGEVTPEKLVSIGQIAQKYDVYTKITGAQRLDLFGVKKSDLPKIWKDLNDAGFESGQAYGKTLRNVKSCVGSTWCRYGIGDSVGLAVRLEERYKGIRSPHKMKGGVSGCVRDCAEFHSKDFGLCAVQDGFNIYVGGNGGMKPAHAQLLASNVRPDEVIPILDRYLMFYITTADRLQRTARWLEGLDGGIEYLKDVIINDKLGICDELESQMRTLVAGYYDEWARAVAEDSDNPIFKQFMNTPETQETVEIVSERGQPRPAHWPEKSADKEFNKITWSSTHWKEVCNSSDLPIAEAGSSTTILEGDTQLALFRTSNGELFCSQNMCGHKRAFVLNQGLLSEDDSKNCYISCPMHKRNYYLKTGACKNDESLSIATFEIKEEDGKVFAKLPPTAELDEVLGTTKWKVKGEETEKGKVKKILASKKLETSKVMLDW